MPPKVIRVVYHETKVKTCVPSIKSLQPSNSSYVLPKDESSTFSLGDALTSWSTVLEQVLEYLDQRDLETVKLINPEWNMCAKRMLKRRMWPAWLGLCKCTRRFSMSQSLMYMKPVVGLLFYNKRIFRLSNKVCVHCSSDHNQMAFRKYLKEDIMVNDLNYVSIGCVVTCNGICPDHVPRFYCKSTFQCILFPKIPNIKISLKAFSPKSFNGKTLHKPNEIIRCALVFTCIPDIPELVKMCKLLRAGRSQDCVPVGGGIVDDARICRKDYQFKSNSDVFSIIFTQKKGVQTEFAAYSHTFFPCSTNFNKSLMKFKKQMILRTHGLVFKFGNRKIIGHEDEMLVIGECFPNYQITGIEVVGQLGWNAASESGALLNLDIQEGMSPPPTKKLRMDKKKKKCPILHKFSTILVVITWGRKLSKSDN